MDLKRASVFLVDLNRASVDAKIWIFVYLKRASGEAKNMLLVYLGRCGKHVFSIRKTRLRRGKNMFLVNVKRGLGVAKTCS